jgi:hypothetical protein
MGALLSALGISSELVIVGTGLYEVGGAIINAFSTDAPDETTAGSAPNNAALLQEIATAQRRILLHWGMSQDAYRQLVGAP